MAILEKIYDRVHQSVQEGLGRACGRGQAARVGAMSEQLECELDLVSWYWRCESGIGEVADISDEQSFLVMPVQICTPREVVACAASRTRIHQQLDISPLLLRALDFFKSGRYLRLYRSSKGLAWELQVGKERWIVCWCLLKSDF